MLMKFYKTKKKANFYTSSMMNQAGNTLPSTSHMTWTILQPTLYNNSHCPSHFSLPPFLSLLSFLSTLSHISPSFCTNPFLFPLPFCLYSSLSLSCIFLSLELVFLVISFSLSLSSLSLSFSLTLSSPPLFFSRMYLLISFPNLYLLSFKFSYPASFPFSSSHHKIFSPTPVVIKLFETITLVS